MARSLSIAAALLGLVAAIVAAAYWWKASRVANRSTTASISDVPELYIQSTQVAFNESSRLMLTPRYGLDWRHCYPPPPPSWACSSSSLLRALICFAESTNRAMPSASCLRESE
jgi:hypothetical protein